MYVLWKTSFTWIPRSHLLKFLKVQVWSLYRKYSITTTAWSPKKARLQVALPSPPQTQATIRSASRLPPTRAARAGSQPCTPWEVSSLRLTWQLERPVRLRAQIRARSKILWRGLRTWMEDYKISDGSKSSRGYVVNLSNRQALLLLWHLRAWWALSEM